MKQTLFSYALVIASALYLEGCGVNFDHAPATSREELLQRTPYTDVYTIELEGHKYIIFSGFRQGGITHSESCPCKKEVSK